MVRARSFDESEDIKPDWLDILFKEHSSYEVGVANSYELDEHDLKLAIKQKILNAIEDCRWNDSMAVEGSIMWSQELGHKKALDKVLEKLGLK